MNLYSVDVKICATAYVKANSPEEALKKVVEQYGGQPGALVEVGESDDVSGRRFDDPELPDISLSPAMTAYGPWEDDVRHVELQEEGV
jgi:hypothetical protein